MTKKRFSVGQKVIRAHVSGYAEHRKVEFENLEITKVGTKWAYAKTLRGSFEQQFNAVTGSGITHRSNEINCIVESREVFEKQQRDHAVRTAFLRSARRLSLHFDLETIPAENILKACNLLGIELDLDQ